MSVIIILGGPLTKDNKPDIWLKSRLDKMKEIYKTYNPDYIIVTGGYPTNEYISEADVMYDYLKNSIPVDKIYKETESTNTYENATKTYKMLINKIQKKEINRISILTSDFHIERSKYIFDNIFRGIKINMISAKTPISDTEMEILKNKEIYLINKLKIMEKKHKDL